MNKVLAEYAPDCHRCHAASLCLPAGLTPEETSVLNRSIREKWHLQKGDMLFKVGEPFKNFYAISSGALKTFNLLEDGREQIHRFYLPGELMGLAAVESGTYRSSAQVLAETEICVVPFDALMQLAATSSNLQKQIIHIMSHRLRLDMMLPHNTTAKERLVAFLLNLSKRLKCGLTMREIALPMSRSDIANHLGLAVETVSRVFSELNDAQIVSVKGKKVKIEKLSALKALANQEVKNG